MESVLLCCNFMGCVYADLGTQGDGLTPLNRLSTNSNVISSYPKYLTSQEKIWPANSLCPSLCGFAKAEKFAMVEKATPEVLKAFGF